jgi:hypothetical protein
VVRESSHAKQAKAALWMVFKQYGGDSKTLTKAQFRTLMETHRMSDHTALDLKSDGKVSGL